MKSNLTHRTTHLFPFHSTEENILLKGGAWNTTCAAILGLFSHHKDFTVPLLVQASVSEGCVSQIWGGGKEDRSRRKRFLKREHLQKEKRLPAYIRIYLTSSCEIRRGKKEIEASTKQESSRIHKHKVNWSKNIFRLSLVVEKVCLLLGAFFEELLWGKIIGSRWSTLPGSPQSSSSTSSSWWANNALKIMWENIRKNILFFTIFRELECGRRGRRWEETTLTKRWVTKQKLRKNELCFPAQSLF